MSEGEAPRYYANWVTLFPGGLDLELGFAYYRPKGEDEPDPEWVARVVLTWEEAVVLHEQLGRQIEDYEANVSPPIRRWEGPPPTIDPRSNGAPEPEPEDDDDQDPPDAPGV